MSITFRSSNDTRELIEDDSDDEFAEVILLCALEKYHRTYFSKKPCRDSELSGHDYIFEVLKGHEIRCYESFRMKKSVFRKLCDVLKEKEWLENSRYVTVEEQVAMFLYVLSHNQRHRVVAERYQHSLETTSHYFHKVLKAICRLGKEIITPPSFDIIPQQIRSNPKYYPFFKVILIFVFLFNYFYDSIMSKLIKWINLCRIASEL